MKSAMMMNKEEEIQQICNLILRSMHSPLSEEEQQRLDSWKSRALRHEELYRKLVEQDFTEEEGSRYERVRNLDDWSTLQRKIQGRGKRFLFLRRLLPYAAILLAGVFAVYFLNDREGRESMPNVVVAGDPILPGQVQAILELRSGEQFVLGKGDSLDMTRLDGMGIVAGDSSLVYVERDSLEVEDHVLRVPRGGEYVLVLSDGTRVWINSESVLRYPSHFVGRERRVRVEGEVYFQVAKNESRPFIVETSEMDVRVTGTAFNVMAYQDRGQVEATLVEGSVVVSAGGQSVKMIPGVQAVFSKNDKRLTTRRVRTELYTSWKDGVFEFNDLSLREIAEYLGRWYDVEFQFGDERVAEIRFTGAVKKMKPITFILDVIKSTKAVDYRIDGKIVIVEKK